MSSLFAILILLLASSVMSSTTSYNEQERKILELLRGHSSSMYTFTVLLLSGSSSQEIEKQLNSVQEKENQLVEILAYSINTTALDNWMVTYRAQSADNRAALEILRKQLASSQTTEKNLAIIEIKSLTNTIIKNFLALFHKGYLLSGKPLNIPTWDEYFFPTITPMATENKKVPTSTPPPPPPTYSYTKPTSRFTRQSVPPAPVFTDSSSSTSFGLSIESLFLYVFGFFGLITIVFGVFFSYKLNRRYSLVLSHDGEDTLFRKMSQNFEQDDSILNTRSTSFSQGNNKSGLDIEFLKKRNSFV